MLNIQQNLEETGIMLRKKPYIEGRKTITEKQLLERVETLQSAGMTDKQIERDTQVKHFKGKIRQAGHQLTGILELEKLIAHKEEIKAQKRAVPEMTPPRKRHPKDPAKKKERRERKMATAAADE
jgi:hypothetical protein